MSDSARIFESPAINAAEETLQAEPCIMLIFGASGDLTRRLLVPALYNLACDGMLPDNFAVLGTAVTPLNSESFREHLSSKEEGIGKFHTRRKFDAEVWEKLIARFHYMPSSFDDLDDFARLREEVVRMGEKYQTGGNTLCYLATSPTFFAQLCENLHHAGFKEGPGWRRIIVEKPFGSDLESARQLNKAILANWDETNIYRIDHYLGKETVQNLLSFRFSNGMFEPLWNRNFIDNIQFNVCEEVDVGKRGGYYDNAGVLRDMMQNHMFQMLAYLCMEPPGSFNADAIRNEKANVLSSVRIYSEKEVHKHFVRGQYGPSRDGDGGSLPGYRETMDVNPQSNTETFAAGKLFIDNWRWEGVPIYLRSGKALWKRSTEIMVQFKKAPQAPFRDTPVGRLASNRLVFHIQPQQGIELLFQAKIPGPQLNLQKVDMRFSYGDAFNSSRYTGYEVLLFSCTHGDATLFTRGDLVEGAWRIAQPVLDYWQSTPAPDFPNYRRGMWGPKVANELLRKDGRHWFEVVTTDTLETLPLFEGADPLLLNAVIMALRPVAATEGEIIIHKGGLSKEMYLICHGEVEVMDDAGHVIETLGDGDFFGEMGLLISSPRTATVRAKTAVDLFVLGKADFSAILRAHPQFAEIMMRVAKERHQVTVSLSQLME